MKKKEIKFSIDKNNKKTRFDYLYENAKIKKNKFEIMQIEKDIKQKKQMIPKITKLAENIKRKQNLFTLRL